MVPISATSGTLPPAIAVTNLSWACAHGTNWMSTFVPGCAAWKSVPYCLTTPWIFGEPGSMIQTLIEPSSLPEAAALPPAVVLLSSEPPQATTTVASATPTAATLNFLIRPPVPPTGRVDWMRRPFTAVDATTYLAGRLARPAPFPAPI